MEQLLNCARNKYQIKVLRVCVCSLTNLACNAHASYFLVIFNIIPNGLALHSKCVALCEVRIKGTSDSVQSL
jgi:hypothetical protein